MLAELFIWQGRLGEVRRVFEGLFRKAHGESRIIALREHWRLDSMLDGREDAGGPLMAARERSPDDDRAWLARANIALRSGRPDEAGAWLRRCEAKAPSDPAVNRLGLEWAMASGVPDEARRALLALAADRLEPVDALVVRAWASARAGDGAAEAQAVDALLAIEPDRVSALDRLAVLAAEAGARDRALEFRRRRARIEDDRQAYRRLMIGDLKALDPARIEECARLAEALGRTFEARGWWTLALERSSNPSTIRDRIEALAERPSRPEHITSDEFASLLASLGDGAPTKEKPPGGDEPARSLAFVDRAGEANLAFVYENGDTDIHQIPATIGGGVGLLDFDGDGRLDVYFTQGGEFPPTGPPAFRDRLFRNRGDGAFEDVTDRSGLAATTGGYGFGVTVGDVDNDGRPDLFVTRWRGYALYRNKGDGTFEDATESWGLGGDRDWPTSSAFADLDGDGDLDLYVCHYLAWDAEHPTLCANSRGSNRYVSCYPPAFPALRDRLFRNDGGRFVDVTEEAGIDDPDGRGLGVVAADLDDDGLVDLVVANDMSANLFYRNKGGMRFEEIAHDAGLAGNAEGGYQAGMGVACGDLDGDGRPDLAITNFYGESTTLFHNLGDALFVDRSTDLGLRAASRFLLGFGASFLDADNDGRLELATANGHVNDHRPALPYAMPARIYALDGRGRLADVSETAGEPWKTPHVARGLAAGDLDDDGRIDLLIVNQNEPATYLKNESGRAGRFIGFRLEGTKSNRDAVGARVTVTAGGRRLTSWRIGGGSYLSASDPRLHFGLGDADAAEAVEVKWPSGRVDQFRDLRANRYYHVREGDAPKAETR
jgi:hypothetical protein